MTIDLAPPLPDQDCFTVDLTGMTSSDGAPLLNPSFTVTTLAGDVNFSGTVTTTDKDLILGVLGPIDETTFYFDVNCNGSITTTDKDIIVGLLGNSAPACP